MTAAIPQSCIDWNRDVLKRELGLDDDDIIDLPILFHVTEENRAVAYYPDMVSRCKFYTRTPPKQKYFLFYLLYILHYIMAKLKNAAKSF